MAMVTRRSLLRAVVPASMLGMGALRAEGAAFLASPKATDVRIEELSHEYEDFLYRTPLKFGGNIVDRVTLLNVHCTVRTRNGKVARGFGSMPLGNVWSFPSKTLSYDDTLGAMKTLASRIQKLTADYDGTGHPIDINADLDPEYHKAAAEVTTQLKLVEPIPAMCTLVTASPFDAAIHDAFGKVHGLNCYQTYGPEFMSHDLSHYLGSKYQGEYISQYVSAEPKPRMPMYHLVGAVDPIEASDIKQRIDDGLPETLPEWINYNGLTHLKIKLNGEDLDWDVDRVVRVDRVTTETQKKRGVETWVYSLDFNEKAPNVGYLLDFMRRVKEQTPNGYDRIQYVEQPTARDLRAHRENVMNEAAKLRPVVIDESLINYEDLLLAREMGYSGVALKACKGQSHAVVLAAAAQKFKMFLCVQDLTCPGASLIQSAGLSAHIPTVHAIEANARQYVPVANQGWEKKFPGLFIVKDGTMKTAGLDKPGLGAV